LHDAINNTRSGKTIFLFISAPFLFGSRSQGIIQDNLGIPAG
jgi:hypothetical protein